MTPRPPHRYSQGAKILAALLDGEWHTSTELIQLVTGRDTLSGRIAELRKLGWDVEQGLPGGYFAFRLRRAA